MTNNGTLKLEAWGGVVGVPSHSKTCVFHRKDQLC